ncbi:hypothetical protein OF83DRAFT_1040796, partial [Amylostereum chailletii]
PFYQMLTLCSPRTKTRFNVWVLFDDGAMTSVMSSRIYHEARNMVDGWQPARRNMRMANGQVVPSKASWAGDFVLEGIVKFGTFEVLEQDGGWDFLLGNPMLRAFQAVHEYATDVIRI